MTVAINGNKGKAKTLISEIERAFSNYDVLRDEVLDQLQNFGFDEIDASYVDKLIDDTTTQINDAKTKVT